MEDCKLVSTPMKTGIKLRKDDESKDVDLRLYRSMIGILLHIILVTPVILLQHVFMFPKEPFFMRKVTGFLFYKTLLKKITAGCTIRRVRRCLIAALCPETGLRHRRRLSYS
jgi:hypothetical protein